MNEEFAPAYVDLYIVYKGKELINQLFQSYGIIDRIPNGVNTLEIEYWNDEVLGVQPTSPELLLMKNPLFTLSVNPNNTKVTITATFNNPFTGTLIWKVIAPDGVWHTVTEELVAATTPFLDLFTDADGFYTVFCYAQNMGCQTVTFEGV